MIITIKNILRRFDWCTNGSHVLVTLGFAIMLCKSLLVSKNVAYFEDGAKCFSNIWNKSNIYLKPKQIKRLNYNICRVKIPTSRDKDVHLTSQKCIMYCVENRCHLCNRWFKDILSLNVFYRYYLTSLKHCLDIM